MKERFVICRTAANVASGCEYWTGTHACLLADDGRGALAYLGTAVSRHSVLLLDDVLTAHSVALWLNTCPLPRAIADVGLWQVLPLGSHPMHPTSSSEVV